MADTTPSAVTHPSNWKFQNSYVERLMDHSALTSVHPDDTLIMAGPPRYLPSANETTTIFDKMLPLGMVQQMQITQQKPTVPAQAIGSGRIYYLSGKAQGNASVARLFVNGRNLLRALHTNAVRGGIDVSKFDDKGALNHNNQFFANLDSELFLIPFGMAVIFRDKIHDTVGAFYLELCMINSWAVAVGAGQSMVMENVNILFDRLLPMDASGINDPASARYADNYDPSSPQDSTLFNTVFGSTGVADTPDLTTK
jgi:hypothetical protein